MCPREFQTCTPRTPPKFHEKTKNELWLERTRFLFCLGFIFVFAPWFCSGSRFEAPSLGVLSQGFEGELEGGTVMVFVKMVRAFAYQSTWTANSRPRRLGSPPLQRLTALNVVFFFSLSTLPSFVLEDLLVLGPQTWALAGKGLPFTKKGRGAEALYCVFFVVVEGPPPPPQTDILSEGKGSEGVGFQGRGVIFKGRTFWYFCLSQTFFSHAHGGDGSNSHVCLTPSEVPRETR